ncbi:endo-1,3-beta-glucanase [Nocardiopsis ansamitocini]|uniref:Endo-1,3-beta-glucanase n=1 Tax=Nocardiopsis ansamitocini TaxID=1670832 RepID=A0A9W6P4G3_9ACTN|nr:endo-1,3-beta-glucanase [Nocardiopsis ansamitocini]
MRRFLPAALAITALAAASLVAVDTLTPEAVDGPEAQLTAGSELMAAPGDLVWSDEFNGAAGSAPDPSKWTHETGAHGWGNQELQNYTTSRGNSALDGNGNLVITAKRESNGSYTSARMVTKDKFERAYGRFEARIQIPRGQGIWPAFWMLGDNFPETQWPHSGEIDIMENIGREPHRVHGSIHGPGYSGGGGITGHYQHPQGWSFADDFHTFAVDWSPNKITWFVDDVAYQTFTPANVGGNKWVYDHPFFMILNVAVGGEWPGYPDGSTQFPQQMRVDYVRVYDNGAGSGGNNGGGGSGASGRITGINGMCLDVAGAVNANGTPLQIAHCNNNQAQNWTMATDGTIRAYGRCMDVTGGRTADSTPVQLWDCAGVPAQKWERTSAGQLRNPNSGKCLDAQGGSGADGTRLVIWPCHSGANQKWNVPA